MTVMFRFVNVNQREIRGATYERCVLVARRAKKKQDERQRERERILREGQRKLRIENQPRTVPFERHNVGPDPFTENGASVLYA